MTSSIARMNCFLHGIEDFRIERGDTLADPTLIEGDHLMRFDVVLANPPYSIKQWDRDAFAADPWGRNLYGTPPKGRADYAFWQHILLSLAPKTGRCAILFPHGVLFRQEEAEMRRKLIEADLIECVLGLGPNLFYNSPMEACVIICRAAKPKARKGRILFVNAVNEVTRERAQSFLTDEHIQRIVASYHSFKDESGFTCVATLEEIRSKDASLSIPLYVAPDVANGKIEVKETASLGRTLNVWLESSNDLAETLAKALPAFQQSKPRASLRGSGTCELLKGKMEWTHVHFGDVVEILNETESDPEAAGLERFIGLEHLEPSSLHIRWWGNVSDGTTFTRRCRPGQSLFGKRRAYQRKVAVAEFDAVVSGDIYVLAPKDDRLQPELLPFICLSERFFQHAVGTSAGSLSPRTNWSSLANFEFDLPPLDQQQRIAEILWTLDEAHEASAEMQSDLLAAKNAFFDNELQQNTITEPMTLKTLGYVLSGIIAGKSPKASSNPAPSNGFGVLKVSAVGDGVFCEEENKALLDTSDFVPQLQVEAGMILVTRCNALLSGIGRACFVDRTRPGLMLSDKTLQLVPNEYLIDRDFLLQGLRSEPYRRFVERSANGTEAKNISQDTLRSAPFWVPSLDVQKRVAERLRQLSNSFECVSRNCQALSALKEMLINVVIS
jgi:type I restriction enzyme M protein